MEVNSITFNGVNSLDYGLYVSGNATFSSAEKDYSKVSVPGRDGDLLISNNRYKNVNVQYPAVIFKDLEENTMKVRNWLMSTNGYCRLEDTYHPDEYRLGVFSGPVDFATALFEVGTTTLRFDCKPQRWLKSGEQVHSYNNPDNCSVVQHLNNPTMFPSKPLIRVYYGDDFPYDATIEIGTGILVVAKPKGEEYETTSNDYIDIDCELMDCYTGTINRNDLVTVGRWPTLTPGTNGITFPTQLDEGGLSKVEIIPRWWIL